MTQKVILFDLWMTLIFGLPTDPIATLQVIVKHRKPGEPLDPAFLAKCLTTNIKDPSRFLQVVMAHFGKPVPRGAVTAFCNLIAQERQAATAYDDAIETLRALKAHGYRIGLISNLWPFPVHRIFRGMDLGSHFEHLVYSFAVGEAKPARSIFDHTATLFGVPNSDCTMVGDSLSSDVQGALAADMQAIFINRSGSQNLLVPPGASVVTSLTAVQKLLIP